LGIGLKEIQAAGNDFNPLILKVIQGLSEIANPTETGAASAWRYWAGGWSQVIAAFDGGAASIEQARAAPPRAGLPAHQGGYCGAGRGPKGSGRTGCRGRRSAEPARGLSLLLFVVEASRAFSGFIKDNTASLRAFAQTIADVVLPGITNLIKQFGVGGEAAKKARLGSASGARRRSGRTINGHGHRDNTNSAGHRRHHWAG